MTLEQVEFYNVSQGVYSEKAPSSPYLINTLINIGYINSRGELFYGPNQVSASNIFVKNALIRNNANALKTLSEDNVTDAPIIQRINAQNEALNKENNDIIAGKDVWETPSHEDPLLTLKRIKKQTSLLTALKK